MLKPVGALLTVFPTGAQGIALFLLSSPQMVVCLLGDVPSIPLLPSSPMGSPPTLLSLPGKTRTKDKYRVVYTDHQRLELEKEFHYSRYITIRRKAELAAALGLTERQVSAAVSWETLSWVEMGMGKGEGTVRGGPTLLHRHPFQTLGCPSCPMWCYPCLCPSSSLHCHLFLSAGENLVSESEGKGEEGEQEEAAAAEPAHQHHHADPPSCQHPGTHRRPLQQQRPQPRLLISTDDQGRIHALTLFTSYRPQEKSTMQQSLASPCALKGDSPFPKT